MGKLSRGQVLVWVRFPILKSQQWPSSAWIWVAEDSGCQRRHVEQVVPDPKIYRSSKQVSPSYDTSSSRWPGGCGIGLRSPFCIGETEGRKWKRWGWS